MAERGGQQGNQNATKNRPWRLAIERAIRKRSRTDAMEALDELAEKLLAKCDEGDLTALKEFGDRIDGKPAQAIDVTGDIGLRKAVEMSDDQLAEIANGSGTAKT